MIRSQKIRDSANGEECTINAVGICCYDAATTVLAHLPDESHGGSLKADDISAAYACGACHDAIDGKKRAEWSEGDWHDFRDNRDWYMRRGQTRTLRKLIAKGIVTVKGHDAKRPELVA